ncbi:MAG TPA: PKD domain-containing protein [Planctomycetota bacterium]|nr:PKD domain-containing protein [Planctomycetota bacterium]
MRFLQTLVASLTMVVAGLMPGGAARAQDADPHATGCRRPTAAELQWADQHMLKTGKVRLNKLGLERVNAERGKKGLAQLTEAEAGVVAVGEEVAASGAGAEAPAILPSYVDNSALKYFPPVRSQGSLGSCAQFSSVYYTLTHMTAMARDWDAKNGGDTLRFSPKWTYNMLNGGANQGTWHYDAYNIAISHGLATWAEFPYDGNYTAWCLTPSVWRNAINVRAYQTGRVSGLDTATGVAQLKQLLANGYVLNYATDIYGWQYKAIANDPATTADDAFVGKNCCYYAVVNSSGHAMTVVGYNDDIWVDMNSNGVVDNGEKGAFRICNSWGTGWNEAGFTWLSYDALKATSAVAGAPSASRVAAWWYNEACWVTARAAYQPRVVAQFTVNAAKRNQLRMNLGISATTATTPASTWYPNLISFQGGALAFNGGTTAVDGTFYYDFTDLAPTTTAAKRWYVGVYDSGTGDPSTLKAFNLYEVKDTGDVLAGSAANVPQAADGGQQKYAWIDYTYNSGNIGPVAMASATPESGAAPLVVAFSSAGSRDPDGAIISWAWNFGDGATATGETASHTYTAAGTFLAALTVTDDKGATGETTLVITVSPDPNQLNAPSGLTAAVSGTTVTLGWTDNAGCEDGFYVERGVTAKGKTTWTRVGTVGANVTAFSQTGVAAGTYLYRVQAFSAVKGVSGYSNQVQAKVGSSGKPPRK